MTKLRRQQFERAEQEMAAAGRALIRLLDEKEALRSDERAIEPPASGTGRQLAALLDQKRAIKSALEALEYRIDAARRFKEEKRKLLKAAHIAYEQAKSIESQAIQKMMAKRKRDEAGRLDEIASQRFWRDRDMGKKERK
ncbi:flagellar FliJ family protein [Hydrogenimonas cancrithermarum]|uniref:flagellar FliJ family protein n=1 Tax=Hydrogenimonas cancrithermarum TaxID=2993563 RepID=UPI00257414BC|nr:hypothetical protein [Hydrogenimonas cancrithermarum]